MGEGNQETDLGDSSGDSSYEVGETTLWEYHRGKSSVKKKDSDSTDTEEAGSTTELGNHRQQGGRGRVVRRGRGSCTVPQHRSARARARGRRGGGGEGVQGGSRGEGGVGHVQLIHRVNSHSY